MKKLLSIVLALCMLVLAIPMSVAASSPSDYAGNSEWTAVSSLAQFRAMESGKKYYLTNNITVPAVAGTEAGTFEPYSATLINGIDNSGNICLILDGCGFSLLFEQGVSFTSYSAIARKLYSGSTIKNLTIGSESSPAIINTGKANIGVLCSGTEANANDTTATTVTVENVTIYGKVDDSGRGANNGVGGFIGKVNGAAVEMKNCEFYGELGNTNEAKTFTYYGGMIGNRAKSAITLTGCVNYATVSDVSVGAGATVSASGGMVGIIAGTDAATITNCENYGDITTKNVAGGIVGNNQGKPTVEGCINGGDITQSLNVADISYYSAGGIVGFTNNKTTVKNCGNLGEYTVKAPLAQSGGIIGGMELGTSITASGNYSLASAELSMITGASVKFSAPTDLRFRTRVSADASYDALVAVFGEGNVKFGTRVAKLSDVTEAGSIEALATGKYTDVERNGWFTEAEDGSKTFTGATASIAAADYGVKYIGVGYISIKVSDVWVTIYAECDTDNARSVAEVAQAAVADRVTETAAGYENQVAADNNYSPYTAEQLSAMQSYCPAQ